MGFQSANRWFFTIYMGKTGRFTVQWDMVSKILDVSSKFRTGIAFTICTNQFHLPENGREYATCTSPIIHLICLA